MTEPATAAGHVIAQKYKLLRQLGQGGMGSVWEAEHLTLSAPVAVKLISPLIAERPEALNRFNREAKAAAALRSSHVVQILDYGVDEGTPFIVMEMLHGESLRERLARNRRLTLQETTTIMNQVARAMNRAHAMQIVHRDLKPDNIFIVEEDEREIVKVLDFGVAKSTTSPYATSGVATRSGALLGTPYYMSPEQAEGGKDIDYRTDLWAMGVIAFECLIGARPFNHEALGGLLLKICTKPLPVPSEVAEVPAGFDEWFARAVARPREERFQSASELADGLTQLLDPTAPRSPATSLTRLSSIPDAATSATPAAATPAAATPAAATPAAATPNAATPAAATPNAAAPAAATPAASTKSRRGGLLLLGVLATATVSGAAFLAFRQGPQPDPAVEASARAATSSEVSPAVQPDASATEPSVSETETPTVSVTPVDSLPIATSPAAPEKPTPPAKRPNAMPKNTTRATAPPPVKRSRPASPRREAPTTREPKRKHDLGI